MRCILLRVDAAVLGRRSNSSELEVRIGGIVGMSISNEDEREDIRESEGMSGDGGGAKPVTQSITRKRGGLVGVDDEWLLERLFNVPLLNNSSKVVEDWLMRSVRWIAV